MISRYLVLRGTGCKNLIFILAVRQTKVQHYPNHKLLKTKRQHTPLLFKLEREIICFFLVDINSSVFFYFSILILTKLSVCAFHFSFRCSK